jgi:uncharacterized protein (DUF433 family)
LYTDNHFHHTEANDMSMNYLQYIQRDPGICGGEPVVTGTRVTIRTVLASLAEGMSVEDIIADFPSLTQASVRAVIAFAAVSAEEDLPLPAIPALA